MTSFFAKRDGDEKPIWRNNAYDKGVGKRAMIRRKIQEQSAREDPDDGFMLFDLGDVVKKVRKWNDKMPRVTPFFAVKCNPDIYVIRILAEMNCGFDCASKGEVQLLREVCGVDANRIINANTWKQSSHIAYAKSVEVKMMTFDSPAELDKVAKIHPEAELVLRLSIFDPSADFPFGIKFGCPLDKAKKLLKKAHKLKLNIIGVSFHIGSGSRNPDVFINAIGQARQVFDWGEKFGYKMYLVDVGGGFPGKKNEIPGKDVPFETFAAAVNKGFDQHFPQSEYPNLRAIAEPGRYFNESAGTLVVNIYGKRKKTHNLDDPEAADDETPGFNGRKLHGYDYFVNNGIFGSFARNLIDYGEVPAFPLDENTRKKKPLPTTVYGDTCAEMDYCNKETHLPECNVGDWLYYEDIGAYHAMNSGTFNGFKPPNKFYYALPTSMLSVVEQLDNDDMQPAGSPWRPTDRRSRGAKAFVSKLMQLAAGDDYSLNDIE